MLKDITLGQYYNTNSIIHRLDPRIKLFGTMIYMASLFFVNKLYGFIPPLLFLLTIIFISKVPLSYIVRGLKPIIFLLIFSAGFNIFFTRGDIIFSWKFISITEQGIGVALLVSCRLILLIIGSSILTLTTTPNNLTDGLEKSLGFLKIIKIPVHEISMMMSIALRFIPILTDEIDKIMKAQMSRGANFQSGGIIKRSKAMIPLLVPLFVSAFRRAEDLGLAMDARCYNGGIGRTKMKPLKYSNMDYMSYCLIGLYLIICIGLRVII